MLTGYSFTDLSLTNLCQYDTTSAISIDCLGNMVYVCRKQKTLNILYRNGTVYKIISEKEINAVYLDSYSRIWVGGDALSIDGEKDNNSQSIFVPAQVDEEDN